LGACSSLGFLLSPEMNRTRAVSTFLWRSLCRRESLYFCYRHLFLGYFEKLYFHFTFYTFSVNRHGIQCLIQILFYLRLYRLSCPKISLSIFEGLSFLMYILVNVVFTFNIIFAYLRVEFYLPSNPLIVCWAFLRIIYILDYILCSWKIWEYWLLILSAEVDGRFLLVVLKIWNVQWLSTLSSSDCCCFFGAHHWWQIKTLW